MSKVGQVFFDICAAIAQRRPWITLATALVLTALAAYASTRLTINTSTEDIIAEDAEFRQVARAYEQAFPSPGSPIIAMIDAGSQSQTREFVARFAERLRGKTEAISNVEIPGSGEFFRQNALLFVETDQLRGFQRRVESAGPLLSALMADPSLRGIAGLMDQLNRGRSAGAEPPPDVSRIVDAMAETTSARAEGRDATLSWSSALGLDLSGGQPTGIVLVFPRLEDTSLDPAQRALDAVRSTFSDLAEGSGTSMRVTGEPALREQELDAAFSGALYASILSFVLVALTLVVGIRSWRVIFALLATLVIGSIWTSGLAAISVRELNLISLAFMVLFFGLGVDFGTHLALRQMELIARGADPTQATSQAIRGEGPAILLSVVCASVGFLSFLPTDYLGLAELGIISALGMLVAAVITLILLPALLTLMPPKVAPRSGDGNRFAAFIDRHAGVTLALAAIVTLGAGALATQARIDVNPLNLQDPDTEAVRAYRDLAAQPQLSPYALNVAAPSLAAARELAPRLEEVRGVEDVRTIDSLVPEDQAEKRDLLSAIARSLANSPAEAPQEPAGSALRQAFGGLREAVGRLAESGDPRAAAPFDKFANALDAFAARQGTDEPALRALDGALTNGLTELGGWLRQTATAGRQDITLENIPQELRREWLAPDGQARVRILPARDITNTEDLEAFARRVQAVAPNATGIPVIVTEAAGVVRRAFLEAIAITAVTIAIILALLRRRLSDVALIMTPLALAAVWTVAGAVLLNLPFNFANVIVIPLLLGLGVASSIHVVVRAREVAKRSVDDTVLETSTPRAVLLTDANTAVAFVTLAISSHRGLSSMGTLLGLAIVLSLIASLVVLPAILELLNRRRAAG